MNLSLSNYISIMELNNHKDLAKRKIHMNPLK